MSATREAPRALDTQRPQGFFLEEERAEIGEVVPVATVFLTNRACPWRCIYCDLWKNTTTEAVPRGAIPAQIDSALAQADLASARQIKLYNAGSFFDPDAIPPDDFPAIADRVRKFERVIVESHPALVNESATRFRDHLGAGTRLEVAMGLEIADDTILKLLNKRMTMAMFARAARFLRANGIAVRAFVMVKPPFVRTDEEALNYAISSIEFAFDCGATVVSLIPARFGPPELDFLAQRGDFAPPRFSTLHAALARGIDLGRDRVFADLWDLEKLEGHEPQRADRLREMNLQQKPLRSLLDSSAFGSSKSGGDAAEIESF